MRIEILESDWGVANRDDIGRLLEDVASHIVRELRDPFDATIRVMNRPSLQCPKALFRSSDAIAHEVNLTAKDCNWSQFAYQFGHEFCHVLSNHDRLRENPNNWLHESLCELASLFVLRCMTERWSTDPPYSNWKDYRMALGKYAESVSTKFKEDTPNGSFKEWLLTREYDMRRNPYLRVMNGVVALKILPVFEECPNGWNAVRHLPVSTGVVAEYIYAWMVEVNDIDRPFVERVGDVLLGG